MVMLGLKDEIDTSALHRAGEHLAAGYFEEPDAPPIRRLARGLCRHFERSPLPEWSGEPLYPCGSTQLPVNHSAIHFSSWSSLNVDRYALQQKIDRHKGSPVAEALAESGNRLNGLYGVGSVIPPEFSLGGRGYTHSIVNYGRILAEGLDGYHARLEHYAAVTDDPQKSDFYAAMRDIFNGLRVLQDRIERHIEESMAANPDLASPGRKLLKALKQVPFRPAHRFYEAMVAANLIWYLDGCDNLGRFDQDLGGYLEADLARGAISREEALDLVRQLWRNVDASSGWNAAIGGSNTDGQPGYNTLTELCLEAAVGRRRPSLALRIRKDMPEAIFDRAVETIASGCGLPALYNEEGYLAALPHTYSEMGSDLYRYAFGGCTETMVHGCSNVGSIDGGMNLLGLLPEMIREHLPGCASFEEFFNIFLKKMCTVIAEAIGYVNKDQELKARYQPQPLRSLLIDDCLERGIDYNAGGARYNTGVFNLGGIANVADSLAAIKELVYGGRVSPQEMIAALEADFEGYEDLLKRVRACPKFGNDDDRVDHIAIQVAEAAFDEIRSHKTWRGQTPFEPACIMFVTYAGAGQNVGATPDGRRAGSPIADSIGPMQGRDTHGPTAMLRSISKLPLHKAVGTPILNIRFAKDLFNSPEGREKFKSLVRACFEMGGMQLQVSVVDQAALRDAIAHPEKYEDLVVRIGGYSEYFNRLTPELKLSVLERTEHR